LGGSGVGADVMKPIAAPIVGSMITSTIHAGFWCPYFFRVNERAARLRLWQLTSRENDRQKTKNFRGD